METSIFTPDALAESGELFVPLVILKENDYVGFIPGFLMKNIHAQTQEECKNELKKYLKIKLKQMMKDNQPFPFFPNKKEILQDYPKAISVEFVKITSSKRKHN